MYHSYNKQEKNFNRLIFQNNAPEAHMASEAPKSEPSPVDSGVTPESAKEEVNAAIDKSVVQLEAYGDLKSGSTASSPTKFRDKSTDWSMGAQARYIPNKSEAGLAYTAGLAHESISDIRAQGKVVNAEKTGDSQFNASVSEDGTVDVIDRTRNMGTAGVEYRVPVIDGVDIFANVTGKAGVEDVSTVSTTPSGEATLMEDQRFTADAEAKLGARANIIGPAYLGGSVGVEQELTGDQDTEFKATGTLGVDF
ncbi:MAG: hypothetical protein OEY44_00315 [Candidatus Peregrinibacteria bacterium]|nr:hypothetical protein [Candidatus Peregrinibacteria bacterium]